jgi:putrescine importer
LLKRTLLGKYSWINHEALIKIPTPMVVFDTFGIVSGITDGRVPLAYILALVAMLLTAFSYARFSRISGDSGSAYNYTAQSCGAKAGFFVGWCSLLDYILLPLVNALLASIYLEAVIPSVPYWLWVVLFMGHGRDRIKTQK